MLRISLVSLYCVAAVITGAAAASTVSADVISETILPNADTVCNEGNADGTWGDYHYLGTRQPWPVIRSYINFDTSMIPHASLRRATLSIYVDIATLDSTHAFHRTPFLWDESTLTWNTQPAPYNQADAFDSLTPLFTWDHAANDLGWHELVLFDDTTDYWESSPNYSLAMVAVLPDRDVLFYSRDSDYAPRIDVEYTDGGQVPEPTTLALLGIGLGGLIVKRRRLGARDE